MLNYSRIGLFLLCLLLAVQAQAARLFTCGYEENNLAETMWHTTGAGTTVVTTAPHSGTYHLQIAGASGKTTTRQLASALGSGSTSYARFYWRTNNAGVANSRIHYNASSGGTIALQIQKNSGATISLINGITTTTQTSSMTVSADTWYRFEYEHVISDTVGSLTLRIYVGDSTSISETLTISSEDTLPGSGVRDFFYQENTANASLTYYFDDIAINDASGSFQTSWTGPGNVALLSPNGDTSVAWTKGGTPAATNWEGVDDVPGTPNDGTDYNYDSGSTNEDRLALSNLPGAVGAGDTMVLMDVYGRVSASASSGTMAFRIWNESGTGTTGPTMTVNSTTWRFTTTAENQAYDLASKTKANVDAFSAGYIAQSGAVEKRISALWANVEWKAAAGSSGTCTLMLLGVGAC